MNADAAQMNAERRTEMNRRNHPVRSSSLQTISIGFPRSSALHLRSSASQGFWPASLQVVK
jgi:hypothetical protein